MYRALYLYCSFITNFSFISSSASCYAALFYGRSSRTKFGKTEQNRVGIDEHWNIFLQCLVYNTDNKLENIYIHTKLLTTDESYKAFSVTENRTNFITGIFFLKYYLDLELLRCPSWVLLSKLSFSNYF